jgi:hypothetical protein
MAQNTRSGQGDVKNPKTDGRTKRSRDNRGASTNRDDDREPGGQGRVKDPDNDRRLKDNR